LIGISKILPISTAQKLSLRSCKSHWPVIGVISSETLVRREAPRTEITFLDGLAGIQGSFQILIDSPLPTLQMHPRLNVAKPTIILCQVKDEFAFGPALRI
jgi:hypothetical protein